MYRCYECNMEIGDVRSHRAIYHDGRGNRMVRITSLSFHNGDCEIRIEPDATDGVESPGLIRHALLKLLDGSMQVEQPPEVVAAMKELWNALVAAT